MCKVSLRLGPFCISLCVFASGICVAYTCHLDSDTIEATLHCSFILAVRDSSMPWPFRLVDNSLPRGNVEGRHGVLFSSNCLLLVGKSLSKLFGFLYLCLGQVRVGFAAGASGASACFDPSRPFPLTYWACKDLLAESWDLGRAIMPWGVCFVCVVGRC